MSSLPATFPLLPQKRLLLSPDAKCVSCPVAWQQLVPCVRSSSYKASVSLAHDMTVFAHTRQLPGWFGTMPWFLGYPAPWYRDLVSPIFLRHLWSPVSSISKSGLPSFLGLSLTPPAASYYTMLLSTNHRLIGESTSINQQLLGPPTGAPSLPDNIYQELISRFPGLHPSPGVLRNWLSIIQASFSSLVPHFHKSYLIYFFSKIFHYFPYVFKKILNFIFSKPHKALGKMASEIF